MAEETSSQQPSELLSINEYQVKLLNKETAERNIDVITKLFNSIPQVHYTAEDVLAESKGARVLHKKWEHSLVVFDGDRIIALVVGYERESEGNEQYPENTLYISELAVDTEYQRKGIARNLLRQFITYNTQLGFLDLEGDTNFSVQTNQAEFNKHVQDLYRDIGFEQRATKVYENRTDIVMGYKPPQQIG